MKKPDPFILLVIAILVVLLAFINAVTENAIQQESQLLNTNLNGLQSDILENMIGDYISSMSLVDDIAIESDSHNVEASMNLMDFMMNAVDPVNRDLILKIFSEDTRYPLAIFNLDSRHIEYTSNERVFYISPKALKEATYYLEKDHFYFIEDVYLTPERELSKQRLYFLKSRFSSRIFITKVIFEGAVEGIKDNSQSALNTTLSKIEKVIKNRVIAINGEGKVVLSSDLDLIPLGTNILRISGNESLIPSLKNVDAENLKISLYNKDKTLKAYDFTWFKTDQIYVLKIDLKEATPLFKSSGFLVQRLLMLVSIAGIVLIIILMRRNFLYFIEKSNTQEGL